MKRFLKIIRIVLISFVTSSVLYGVFYYGYDVDAAGGKNNLFADGINVAIKSVQYDDFLKELEESGDSVYGMIDRSQAVLDDVDAMFGYHTDDDPNDINECKNGRDLKNVLISNIIKENSNGSIDSSQKAAMLYNTWFLQQLIYCGSLNNQSTTIRLPEGTFYFMSGHKYKTEENKNDGVTVENMERHVIKLHDNITIIGAGEGSTFLKPYSETGEFKDEYGNDIQGGVDMFFYNKLGSLTGAQQEEKGKIVDLGLYLNNIHFSNFTIDSEKTEGPIYNTAGKGFMINLFNNGTWDYVTVKNTDATGFGVDCPIGDSWIRNSTAIGNGKGIEGDPYLGGGSGFGIGEGYNDDERFLIENSYAEGNGKYGFFYEHQNRFGYNVYRKTGGNFVIRNSTAKANMWNYGGLRSNHVNYTGITSEAGEYEQSNGNIVETLRHVYFSDESRDVKLSNVKIDGTIFTDVDKTAWYADAIEWAERMGITSDVININENNMRDNVAINTTFGVGEKASRYEVVAMVWRMMNFEGTVLSAENNNITQRMPYTLTCFWDVNESYASRPFAGSIQWASTRNPYIIDGVDGSCKDWTARFLGERDVKRNEMVVILSRIGVDKDTDSTDSEGEGFCDVKKNDESAAWYYDAVSWADKSGITNGAKKSYEDPNLECDDSNDGKDEKKEHRWFYPEENVTREQVVAFLYRYWAKNICPSSDDKDQCPKIEVLLDVNHNK